ncbi:hypothetical protein [Aquabacterium sp.]|uniref:hypothetical protein n=1 Tax=Aquabacterium sp. TaxID=1872578 RepID=UPI0037843400
MSFGRWPRAAWGVLSLASVLFAGCSGDDEALAPLPASLLVIVPERVEVDQAAEFGANADASGNGLSHQWDYGDGGVLLTTATGGR